MNIQNEILDIVQRHIRGIYDDTLTRFSYLGAGANDFFRLTHNPAYNGYDRELRLISRMFNNYNIPPINNIIEFGPGDGLKSGLLMNIFNPPNYTAIDISERMLRICKENHSGINNVEREYIESEFHETVDNIDCKQSFYVILGNTLANHMEMQKTLSMMNNEGSCILLGIELINGHIDEILAEYRTPENYALTFRPLEYIGIPRTSGNIDIIFNNERSRIEEWFILSQDYLVDEYLIPRESRILLSITQKPTFQHLQECIRDAGLDIMQHERESNQSLMLLNALSVPSVLI